MASRSNESIACIFCIGSYYHLQYQRESITYLGNIELAQALLLILVNSHRLVSIDPEPGYFYFSLSPMFWIAGGTLFYYSMFLLTQSLPEYNPILTGHNIAAKTSSVAHHYFHSICFLYRSPRSVAAKKNQDDSMIILLNFHLGNLSLND